MYEMKRKAENKSRHPLTSTHLCQSQSISINFIISRFSHTISLSLSPSLSPSLSLSLNIHTYIYTPPITCLAKSVIKHKVDLLLQGRACRIRAQIGIALGPGRGGAPRGRWCWVCKARGRDVRKSKYQCASFCVGRIPNSFTSLFSPHTQT